MNYKETLFFVGKCLTITHEEHNRMLIEDQIKSGNIDWDNVVRLSTEHYVFPALYCNLKRVSLLQYLPSELVDYMKHITDLNRERNLQIIEQAKEINELLLVNNITPIFLKGTGNLLDGLYEDVAERMVGDIDFLVDKNSAVKAISILSLNKYETINNLLDYSDYIKHYPRMIKKGCVCAIEVHLEMTLKKFNSIFNYQIIKPQIRKLGLITLLSYEDQIAHTIINKQLNDYGYLYKNIALRNYYDLFLLSRKANTLKSIQRFPSIFKPLNTFLAVASNIFPNTNHIHFEKKLNTLRAQKSVLKLLESPKRMHFRNTLIKQFQLTNSRLLLLTKALYNKNAFFYVLNRLNDINLYKRLFFLDKTSL